MKLIKEITFLLIILLVISCIKNDNNKKPESVIISGRILSFDSKKPVVNFYINRLGFNPLHLTDSIDERGNFSVFFETYNPTDLSISYNTNFSIVAHPGDSIHVEFDGSLTEGAKILSSLKFSGDAAKTNENILRFNQAYLQMFRYWQSHDKIIRDYNETEYIEFIDSLKNVSIKLLSNYNNENNADIDVENYAKTMIEYQYYSALADYPSLHKKSNNLGYTDWNVPISYYEPLINFLPLKKEMFVNSNALNGIAGLYSYFYARQKSWYDNGNKKYLVANGWGIATPPGTSQDSIFLQGILTHTHDILLKQILLTQMFEGKLEKSELKFVEKHIAVADSIIQEPFLREPLFALFHKVKDQFENPQFESGIEFKNTAQSTAKEIMRDIIQDNKGKVIYIDCWATWCGPCIEEMPNSKELMSKLKNYEVAFIYLCLDSKEMIWKSSLAELKLGGQQYYLSDKQSRDFRNIHQIDGIPHYILINKKGSIVEKGSHLRPNNVKEKIEKLLKE